MQDFQREIHTINGVKTVVLTAGQGEPLVFFHGGGTFHGFEFAHRWAERYRVLIPYHPGFGESGDDSAMNDIFDYVMHYLELFDVLGLDQVRLVGFSLGGHLAARFALEHSDRIKKLVLIGPSGLKDDKHPSADLFSVPPEQVPGMLVSNFDVIKRHLPEKPDVDFLAERYREMSTCARLLWERPWDPRLKRYLHRIKSPTLLLWGEEDRIIPAQQGETWKQLIPNAQLRIFKNAGHLVLDETADAVAEVERFVA